MTRTWRNVVALLATGIAAIGAFAQKPPELLSRAVADAAIARWPEGNLNADHAPQIWQYQEGTLLLGITAVAESTGDQKYSTYMKQAVDHVVDRDGNMTGYKVDEYSLDQVLMGRQLMLLCHDTKDTQDPRYCKAAKTLRQQIAQQPRTKAGGFWHKKIYPSQMWLDGLYMAEPFYAEYAKTLHESADFDDIARQFIVLEQHARDPKTGLLYHGWDESKQMPWADKQTGLSPSFWARGMGWYAMALVDTLPYFPANDPHRGELLTILNRLAVAIVKYQEPKTGVWFEVMDKPDAPKNFPESSASSMFVYSLLKGVRLGYLPASFAGSGRRGWDGIRRQFVETGPDHVSHVTHIVKGAGLGGTPYRSGTYDYYVGELVMSDEPKGIGAFLLAASEAERPAEAKR